MRILLTSKWTLLFLLLTTCILVTHGRRGGGGSRGGSRGSSSRGSSSRGSSRDSSRGGTTIDRGRDRGRTENRNPSPPAPPPPKAPEPAPKRPSYPSPRPQPKPSAPQESPVVRQPAQNPNFKEQSPNQAAGVNQQQPPPYSPRERPPPYSPNAPGPQGPAPPPYSPSGGQSIPHQQSGVAPPAYPGGIPSANYPRQPGFPTNPQQPGGVAPPAYPGGGIPSANYPRQPGMQPGGYPPQGGVNNANYPRQPGMPSGSYPPQGGVNSANYPRQPGMPSGGYHQPGGIPNANYPRQPNYPPQTLGSNVWQPQSGRPSPAYMNYGGLPTGTNMYSQPMKQKGFLGSLSSMGGPSKKHNKYYGSRPSPYGMGAGLGVGMLAGGLMGSAAMYTILPYMAMRSSSGFFRPSYGYGHYYGHGYGHGYGHTHYDVYNDNYVGRCNRPITPDHAKVMCNSTRNQVDCDVTCEEGYRYPDNTTNKMNKCWHATGVWKPTKNFEACEPVCNEICLNGGKCASPGMCGCSPEYRGPHCEFHFLNCDIRKLANGVKIRWVCTHTKNETSCRVKCRAPEEFATSSEALLYTCTPDGAWTPSSMPQCVSPEAKNVTETAGVDATKVTEEENTTEGIVTKGEGNITEGIVTKGEENVTKDPKEET